MKRRGSIVRAAAVLCVLFPCSAWAVRGSGFLVPGSGFRGTLNVIPPPAPKQTPQPVPDPSPAAAPDREIVFGMPAAALAQRGAGGVPSLRVSGDVATVLSLTAADLQAMPRTKVEIKEQARAVTYEGVLVRDILQRAGVPTGADLRGDVLASYVVASAPDDYQVVFSIAELDPGLSAHEVIVADRVDGKPISPAQGPLRLVVPRDTRPARSVRMLDRLDVVRLKK
jgi:DMSO/TMAO reductase YedYZ molybdopterin-dependent catalytic subunit